MTLAPDLTVTGHLTIPAGVHPGGEQVNADLRGTYSIDEGAVTFQLSTNTVIRNTTWYYSEGGDWLSIIDSGQQGIYATLQRR